MSSAANAQEISLSPVQKLAALMILLGEEAAGIILKTFDKNERELVCSEMANLPMLGLEQQQSILREFTERAVAANSSLEGSEEYTKKVLERAVGMFEAEEIIGRVSMSRTSVAAMQQIIDMDSLGVTNLIKEEQPHQDCEDETLNVMTIDGQRLHLGRNDQYLCVGNHISLAVFATALEVLGQDVVMEFIATEPSGVKSNTAVLNADNVPYNPFMWNGMLTLISLLDEKLRVPDMGMKEQT